MENRLGAYENLKKEYLRGWHTWNVRSVLSHVHMPYGFHLNLAFKSYSCGKYLKETLIGRRQNASGDAETVFPGIHAADDSYTCLRMRWLDADFEVESCAEGETLILLVTPVSGPAHPPMLVVESGFLWGKRGYVEREGDHLLAHGPDFQKTVYITGEETDDKNIPVQTAYLAVFINQPVAVSTDRRITASEARKIMDRKKSRYREGLLKYSGDAELYEAMESALGWDTVYEPMGNRVISPVSRIWSINDGGFVLFCWDTFFAGYMASLLKPELGIGNLLEILDTARECGFVPNFTYGTGQASLDRSQPPVGSAMLLQAYRVLGEKWLIEEMFDGLLRWNTWFYDTRRNEDGTFSWGSSPISVRYGNIWETTGVNDTYGGALESGLDNSPMYDGIPFDKQAHRMRLSDVGLTGLIILDLRCLMRLAAEIGREDAGEILQKRLRETEKGLETLWDEENGFYYNRRRDTGEFSRRISPTNFYALFSENVPQARRERMLREHYFNPEEFYGEWMLPSIARNDAAFQEQDYWRGRVWAPLNFLVYIAFSDSALSEGRRDLAEKSREIFLGEWRGHRHIHENYSAVTGEGCDSENSDRFYHWGALLCAICLAEDGYIPGLGLSANGK